MTTPAPLIDLENPLYCPEVSAHQYMSSVRLFQASVADASRFPYFHRMCNVLKDNDVNDSPESPPLQLLKEQLLLKNLAPVDREFIVVKKEQGEGNIEILSSVAKRESEGDSPGSSGAFLKRPPKRVKRSSSYIDMSFVLSAKAERLQFSDEIGQRPSSVLTTGQRSKHIPDEELFWPEGHTEGHEPKCLVESGYKSCRAELKRTEGCSTSTSPVKCKSVSALLDHLEKLLPGVRLKSKLGPSVPTHQDIVDLLGMKGHLNPQTISLFRSAQIRSLRLSESMIDADGLNLQRYDTLKILRDPAGFGSLRSIILSDVPLCDDDLACLNNLHCLESLFLDDTQIGDVAVMHLIAHRQSLVHLELSWNERITDEAIPTLCNFLKLSFISFKGTTITMHGLRRLACSVKEKGQNISIVLPSECEEYICSKHLHEEYEVDLPSPLIHLNACCTLSEAALAENLAVHAGHNPGITENGTKIELEGRLREILDRRKKDMVVQGFMLQGFA